MPSLSPGDVLTFWREAGETRWYKKDNAFDQEICDRFMEAYEQAARGNLSSWEETDEGALALLILLDQFPRNMFRNDARAFATDPLALAIAKRAIARGADSRTAPPLKQFFYLPLMHSENLTDQGHCIALFEAAGGADNIKFAHIHADIIRRFGRFPHRNKVLQRDTTPDEQAFLESGGFAG